MAKAEQIKALIRCHAEGDNTRFYAVAIQVAAQAARSGHGNLAQELRDLVDRAKTQSKTVDLSVLRAPCHSLNHEVNSQASSLLDIRGRSLQTCP